jgi:hypothetical protein
MISRQHVPALVALVVAASGLVAAWHFWPGDTKEARASGTVIEFPQFHCRYSKPAAPWHDGAQAIAAALKACLVLERGQPRTWVALVVENINDRLPSDRELTETIMDRLGGYFYKESLESDDGGSVEMAGHSAHRLVFHGDVESVPMIGECAILTMGSNAYFLILWAPRANAEASARDYADLRGRLAIPDAGKGNKTDSRPKNRVFQALDAPVAITVDDPGWEKWEPANDYDPLAVLALVAHQRKAKSEKGPPPPIVATVLLLGLKPGAAVVALAEKRAIEYLEKQQKQVYPETQLDRQEEEKSLTTQAGQPLSLVSFKVRNGEHRHRNCLLGVANTKEAVWVVLCESDWSARNEWRSAFMQAIRGLRLQDEKREDR